MFSCNLVVEDTVISAVGGSIGMVQLTVRDVTCRHSVTLSITYAEARAYISAVVASDEVTPAAYLLAERVQEQIINALPADYNKDDSAGYRLI